jgi:hypothetical protein
VREVFPRVDYYAIYECEVVSQSGDLLDVRPVRAATGMPALSRVVMRPGVAGATATLPARSKVLVGFVDGDPSRPYVAAYAAVSEPGGIPSLVSIDGNSVALGAGLGRVLREGDTLTLTGVQPGPSATGVQAIVTLGLGVPPTPSRVRA